MCRASRLFIALSADKLYTRSVDVIKILRSDRYYNGKEKESSKEEEARVVALSFNASLKDILSKEKSLAAGGGFFLVFMVIFAHDFAQKPFWRRLARPQG